MHSFAAGWSSPVARQAHNLKVTGSNPVPAPKSLNNPALAPLRRGFLLFGSQLGTEAPFKILIYVADVRHMDCAKA
jgi:hypothetical protein